MIFEAARHPLAAALRGAVFDPRVRDAVLDTPRPLYAGDRSPEEAWEDRALSIGLGQTISQPSLVAQMTELLELGPDDTVLDVGTGSGYQGAILARLAGRVFGVERIVPLARRARRNWDRDPGVGPHAHVVAADAYLGFPGTLRFDAAVVAAACRELPEPLLAQIAPGGRVVAPLGPPGMQQLVRLRRGRRGWAREELGLCAFVPLVPGGP